MTIYELSLEYKQTAEGLCRRITDLEKSSRETQDEAMKHHLEGRARALRSMYRDVRKVTRYLEHYYNRQPPKKKAGVKRGRGGRSDARSFV